MELDLRCLTPADRMRGEDEEETSRLGAMLADAEEYLTSFAWCPSIRGRYFGKGVGDVVAVFLFELEEKAGGTDDRLWVVVGDLPSAYFVVDEAHDPGQTLEVYCSLMEDWASAVLDGRSLEEAYPVRVEPTRDHAKALRSRIDFLRKQVVPAWLASRG